jgi:hypothetical protein
MRIEDLEKMLLSNIGSLSEACRGICRSDVVYIPRLEVGNVLDGCDYCLLRNLIDLINVKSITIVLRNGDYLEFLKLDDAVIELGPEAASILALDEFVSRVMELREFNMILDDDVNSLIDWFNS